MTWLRFWWAYTLGLLLLIVLVVLTATGEATWLPGWWQDAEPLSGIFGAFVATLILFQEWVRWRRESLPRRLTVRYWFGEGPPELRLEDYLQHHPDAVVGGRELAYLAHEGDARQLAQQIAQQIYKGRVAFEADRIVESERGVERDALNQRVYVLHLDVRLTSSRQAEEFRARSLMTSAERDRHDAEKASAKRETELERDRERLREVAGRSAARALRETGTRTEALAAIIGDHVAKKLATVKPRELVQGRADDETSIRLFVCGGDAAPPTGFEVQRCPSTMDATSVREAALAVRDRLADVARAQILIKGPITLGVALGQVLEHIPCRVEFLQLDQATKQTSVWWSNTRVE